MLNNIKKYFTEPYINVLCVELGTPVKEYKKKRMITIIVGIALAAIFISAGVVLRNLLLLVLGISFGWVGYRYQYWKIKRLQQKTREELLSIYPIFIQTFISLLYTNDNLIKVFLLLESYHFHPYIDRSLVIMINKYQLNPENYELIFAEFCNIFETSSASLLHQLLVNINRFGVNDTEIELLEAKVDIECDKLMAANSKETTQKLIQYGAIGVTSFVTLLLVMLIFAI